MISSAKPNSCRRKLRLIDPRGPLSTVAMPEIIRKMTVSRRAVRLLSENRDDFNGSTVVYQPARMAIDELRHARIAAFHEFFTPAEADRCRGSATTWNRTGRAGSPAASAGAHARS